MNPLDRRKAFRAILYCPDCKVVLYHMRFGCWWGQGRGWTAWAIPAGLLLCSIGMMLPMSVTSLLLGMLGAVLCVFGGISIPFHLTDKPDRPICPHCGFGTGGRTLAETVAAWIPAQDGASGYWLFRDDFKKLVEQKNDPTTGDLTLLSGGRTT